MAKKNDNILGLAPMSKTLPKLGSENGLVPFQPNRQLSGAEKRILAAFHREKLVIDATTAKTVFGMSKISELQQHTAQEFDETVGYIMAIKNEPGRTADHQAYVEAFSHRQVQLFALHLSTALDIGAQNIGVEVQRSLHFDEEERAGFFARLFGADDD